MPSFEIKYDDSKGLVANLKSLNRAAAEYLNFKGEVPVKAWKRVSNVITESLATAYIKEQSSMSLLPQTIKRKERQVGQTLVRGFATPSTGKGRRAFVKTKGMQTGFLLERIAEPSKLPGSSKYKPEIIRSGKSKNFKQNIFFYRLSAELFYGRPGYILRRPPFRPEDRDGYKSSKEPEIMVMVTPKGVFLGSTMTGVISQTTFNYIAALLRNETFAKQFTETFGKMK